MQEIENVKQLLSGDAANQYLGIILARSVLKWNDREICECIVNNWKVWKDVKDYNDRVEKRIYFLNTELTIALEDNIPITCRYWFKNATCNEIQISPNLERKFYNDLIIYFNELIKEYEKENENRRL